jgi:hypothetical protein
LKHLTSISAVAVLAGALALSLPGCASPKFDPAVADASNPATVTAFEA